MRLIRLLITRMRCRQGRHAGENFCAACGAQLVAHPFYPFRVINPADGSEEVIYGYNIHHVLSRFPERGRTLIVQRLPGP